MANALKAKSGKGSSTGGSSGGGSTSGGVTGRGGKGGGKSALRISRASKSKGPKITKGNSRSYVAIGGKKAAAMKERYMARQRKSAWNRAHAGDAF